MPGTASCRGLRVGDGGGVPIVPQGATCATVRLIKLTAAREIRTGSHADFRPFVV